MVGVFGKRAHFYAPPSPAIGRFGSAIVLRVHSGFEWASPALTSASVSAVAFCRQAAWRQGAIVVGRVLRLNLLFEPSTYQLWMLRQVLDFKFVREFGIPASYAHSMNCRRCLCVKTCSFRIIGWIILNLIADCPCRNATTGANILNV